MSIYIEFEEQPPSDRELEHLEEVGIDENEGLVINQSVVNLENIELICQHQVQIIKLRHKKIRRIKPHERFCDNNLIAYELITNME